MKFFLNRKISGIPWAFILFSLAASSWAKEWPASPVSVAVAEQQNISPATWYAGNVKSRQEALVSTEISGRIVRLVEVGDDLKAGDVIAKIDDELLQIQLKERALEVFRVKARLDFLEKEVLRLTRLAKQNNAAKTRYEETVADRNVSRADLQLAKAREEQTKIQISRTLLKAPFAGTVLARLKQPAEWVQTGTAIVKFVSSRLLEVQAMVSIDSRSFLKRKDSLKIAYGGQIYSGVIKRFTLAGNDVSRMLDVRLDLTGDHWVAGQGVRVLVPSAVSHSAVTVPRDALVLRRQGASVYRVSEDNQAEKLSVKVGDGSGSDIEVIGGIKPGDRVITRGGERLRPGQKVRVINQGVE